MNNIQVKGLLLNFIIYIIMILPIYIFINKNIYEKKSKFVLYVIKLTIFEIFLSFFIYAFPKKIFSIFTNINGIINYATYASKYLFITSSLYALKILTPFYLYSSNKKKSAILFISKIADTLIFILIGYKLFNIKGILFAIPLCDLVYCIVYTILIIFY